MTVDIYSYHPRATRQGLDPPLSREYGQISSFPPGGYESTGTSPGLGSNRNFAGWDTPPTNPGSSPNAGWEILQTSPGSESNRSYAGRETSQTSAGNLKPNLANHHSQRRRSNRDEFDGPHEFLSWSSSRETPKDEELPLLPTNLDAQEQDGILGKVNDCLCQCAFAFIAKYHFPIPLESDKRPVRIPADREWSEWVYLLTRLATKRRIPARVLYNNQIKQFITVLESSLEMRHAAKHQSRPLKDDWNVLQLISAGIQVARILKDAGAMDDLGRLYSWTETRIHGRKAAKNSYLDPTAHQRAHQSEMRYVV